MAARADASRTTCASMPRMKVFAWLAPALLFAQDPVRTNFEVLAGFEWTAGMELPAEVKELDGKSVRVRGFMVREVPGSAPVTQFLLINDACGCNGTPKMNEIVFCALPEGQTIEIKAGVVEVTGTLWVGEQTEEGEVVAIYVLDADSVQ